jgi:hypothetical protein
VTQLLTTLVADGSSGNEQLIFLLFMRSLSFQSNFFSLLRNGASEVE